MQTKAKDLHIEPVVKMSSIIKLMKNAGFVFNYAIFTKLVESGQLQNLVASYNRDQVVIKTEKPTETKSLEKTYDDPDVKNQKIVGKMAKRALKF